MGGFDLEPTERRGHARDLAYEAAESGYDVIVAAGGDGTVHEVVNGLYRAAKPDVKLGIIPIGSGNDFAFGMGLLDDLETAVTRLYYGSPQAIDLAVVTDDHGRSAVFHNNFGVGLDANVVIRTEAITNVHGFMMYLWGVLKTIALDFYLVPFDFSFDNEQVTQEALLMSFGLGPRHGGGFLLTPDANQRDGLIDTCLVHPMNRLTAIRLLIDSTKGTHIHSDRVTMRQNKRIEVRSKTAMPIHIDGEVFAQPADNVHKVTVLCLPAAMQVMV
jgi:YegS/Rv2252/BmrU family lipid kinase